MKKYLLLSALCVFACTASYSQSDTIPDSYLNEVVISANRWEQNIRDIPFAIAKLTKATIQFQNPQTSADLLGLTNQVFIQKSQLGGGSPMIRGFATNRILLAIDGVRMNNAIFRSGNLQNVISVDANAIRETEVIFGPGSVIYGSDAIGGVMDFHTLRPEFSGSEGLKFSANALARYSSANNEKTGHIDFTIGLNKLAFTTSITKSIYENLKMGDDGPIAYTRPDYQVRDGSTDIAVINPDLNEQIESGYDQLNLMHKIRFKPTNDLAFSYGFHYSKTSDVPRYDRLILKNDTDADGIRDEFVSAEWYYGPQEWTMHTLNTLYTQSSGFFDQAKLTLAYQDYSESRHNRNFTGGNRNRKTERFENVKAFSVNLDLDKTLNVATSLFYGVEFVTNDVESISRRIDITNASITPVSTRYPNGSEWRSLAAYVSARHKLSEPVTLNAGVRYTNVYTYAPYDTSTFDFQFTEATLRNGAFNGSLGITVNPTTDTKLYSNLSTGFRAPNVDDIGKVFDSSPGSVLVPNPDLKPETAYNAEIGFTGKVISSLEINIAAYYTLLDNAITRGAFLFNGLDSIDYDGELSGVIALQNTSKVEILGTQLSARWQVNKNFQVYSAINFQKGEEKDPATGETYSPTHVAPTFGSTQISYTNKWCKTMLYANYNGEIEYDNLALTERLDSHLYAKDKNGNPYAPSWFTLNFKSSFTILPQLMVDAGVENIFNKGIAHIHQA